MNPFLLFLLIGIVIYLLFSSSFSLMIFLDSLVLILILYWKSIFQTTAFKLSSSGYKNSRDGPNFIYYDWYIDKAKEYIEEVKKEMQGKIIQPSHIIGWAVSKAMKDCPQLNSKLPWGTLIKESKIDSCYLVALDDGKNFTNVYVRNSDKMSPLEIGDELASKARGLRKHTEVEYKEQSKSLELLPPFFLQIFSRVILYLTCYLNVDFFYKLFKVHSRPFGSFIITNVGAMGYEKLMTPIPPISHAPIIFAMGKIKQEITVENRIPVIKDCITISITFDCRYLNIVQLKEFYNKFTSYLNDPRKYLSNF